MAIETTNKETMSLADFKKLAGDQFGGGSNHLEMEPESVAGPFTHVKVEKNVKLSDDMEAIDLFVADGPDGEIRMPASAVFRNNAEEAKLNPGDKYFVARLADTTKKKGKGKGRPMSVYAIKIVSRNKKKS